MAKIVLDRIQSGYLSTLQWNNNNQTVEDHLNEQVLYRNNPAGEPNQMLNLLDMNSNDIINANGVFAKDIIIDGISLGGSVQLAQDWAVLLNTLVDNIDYSSKEWAIGTTVPSGSSKDWATFPEDSPVNPGGEFSAFHWASKAADVFADASAAEDVVLVDGQLIVDFNDFNITGSGIYVLGDNVDRGRLTAPDDYAITGPKQVTLNNSYPTGTIIKAAIANTGETGAADIAIANAGYAEEWANLPEDVFVSSDAGGDQIDDFSSLHWSKKAEIFANIAGGSATEDITLTDGQLIVTFNDFSQNGAALYVIGDNVDSGRLTSPLDYVVDSPSQITLANSYPLGTILKSAVSETAETGAIEDANLRVGWAQEWANKAENSLVSAPAGGDLVDDFSALHWSRKAEDFKDAAEAIAGDLASQQLTYVVKTANFSPVNGQALAVDTTLNVVTITLPIAPVPGDTIRIVDYAGTFNTFNCTVARNGENIMGLAEDMNLDLNFSSSDFKFVDSTRGWIIV